MALVMTPIYTQTVGAGGAASVTFNNIPQVYTDLKLVVSARSSSTSGTIWDSPFVDFNGVTTNQSVTFLYGNGASVGSARDTRQYIVYGAETSSATSNTFGNGELYIPNYTSNNFKSSIADGVTENNATTSGLALTANLWRSTDAITSIKLSPSSGTNFVQYSTFSLYGIIRQGA